MPRLAGLINAIVIQIDDKSAEILTENGQSITLKWEGLSWARRFQDPDHQGQAPKTTRDILKQGDLIRIYEETPNKGAPYWRLAQAPKVAGALISISPDNGAIRALVGGRACRAWRRG